MRKKLILPCKQIVGSLRYLCNTRPDIAYCVGLINRFMEKPKTPHFLAAKRIPRYVKGTLDLGILYPYNQNNIKGEVFDYSDSDWCGDKDDRKSYWVCFQIWNITNLFAQRSRV